MPTQVQFRRGNTAQHSTFTGALAELTVDTEKKTVVVHDGVTAGGFPLAADPSAQISAISNTANSKVSKTGDAMTGPLSTSSNIWGNIVYANTEFYAGVATYAATILPNTAAQFSGNSSVYSQVNHQNINENGSADNVVTADVGDDATFYITTGIQNSQLNQGALYALDGYVLVQGNTGQVGGNLVIGTISGQPGQETRIVAGGFEEGNVIVRVQETGTVIAGNVTPSTDDEYYLGSDTKRWHSLYVGPGSVDIDGIVLSNVNGQLKITGATDFVVGSSPSTQGISDKANAAYLAANNAITYTDNAIANLVNSAPTTLDTLNELAVALGNDANFSTTILTTIGVSGGYANGAFVAANTADQRAVTSGVYANSAYSQANTATTNAATADQKAVTSGDYANSAYIKANSSFAHSNLTLGYAESAYTQANTVTILAQSSYDFANTLSSGSAYDSTARQDATSAGSYANGSFAAANTADQKAVSAGSYANSAYLQANTGTILAQAAFDSANNVAPQIQPSFDQANTATQYATSAGSYANGAFVAANTATQYATSAGSYANSAYLQANTATTNAATADQKAVTSGDYANSAYIAANTADQKAVTSGDYANSAYTQANTATTNAATADQRAVTSGNYANSAYAHANTKFSSSGGTISGSVTINGGDLTVTGNLTIGGNTTSVSANNLVIDDSIIYLANNASSNTHDIGIVGQFEEGSYQHTGLVRDSSDGKWKFFSNVAAEPTGSTVDFTGAYWDTVKVGIIEAETANVGNFNLVTHIGSTYNHANASYIAANTADQKAVTSGSYANSAYAKANTSLQNNADGSTSGTLYSAAVVSNTSVQVNTNAGSEGGLIMTGGFVPFTIARQTSGNYNTSSTSQVTIDSFVSGSGGYRSAKYLVQMTSGSSYHMIELSIIHDGTTVYMSQYGEVMSGSSLGTFDATIASSTLSLKFTPTNSVTKVDWVRTALAV